MDIFTRVKSVIAICAFTVNAFSQSLGTGQPIPNRGCATPILPDQFENWLRGLSQPTQSRLNGGQIQSVFNIPVIVHIIHNNEPLNSSTATSGGNLNAAQVIDQINILNKDFNGLNSDTSLIPTTFKPVQGKFQFNFCLAVVNPTGGVLSEPGINRINRNTLGFTAPPYTTSYISNTIKPATIWNPARYLNIWVCSITGGILGYATFPNPGASGLQGLSAPYGGTTNDGVVILNSSFGSVGTAVNSSPYHKGRTATHEVGHWVGLRHVWGDGTCATDYCNDTPPAQNANYGCPTHPYKSGVCSGNTTGEMFMNYMDYTNDACMYMFSNDQKYRAQLIMINSSLRLSLLSSTVCTLPSTTNDIGIMYVNSPTYSQVITCSNSINPVIIVHNYGSNTITSATYTYNLNGTNTQTFSWSGSLSPGSSATITMPQVANLANGAQSYNVGVFAPNGGSDANMVNNTNNQLFTIASTFTLSPTGPSTVCSGNQATLTVSGGASGYTWYPGGTTGTIAVVTPSATSIYTVSGSLSTCVNSRTISVGVNVTPTVTVNSPSICAGNSAVLNATGACSYTWMPGNLTGPSVTVNPSGSTQFTVIGACSGCSSRQSGSVTVIPQPTLNLTTAPTGSLCVGGTATITATGATGYNWNTGASGSQLVVSPTTNTSYTVTGANGTCTSTATTIVPVGGTAFSINIAPSPATLCIGSTLTLTATGANTYSWTGGGTGNQLQVNPSSNTGYTVTGINGICSASAAVVASVVANPTVSLNAAPLTTICAGESVTLTATGANQYSWSNTASLSSTVVNPTVTTTFTVTGNSLGCRDSKMHTVVVGASTLGLSIISTADSICIGSSATITASGLSTYSWSTGSNMAAIVVSPSLTTTYTLDGASGPCPANAAITLTVKPASLVQVSIAPSATICAGTTATLSATGNYSIFNWSNGGSGSNIVIAPGASTNFSVQAGGSQNGCLGSSSLAVIVSPNPLSILTISNTTCIDSVCNGFVAAFSSGGITPYTYSIQGGNCNALPCNNLCAGFYKLVTTDSMGCKSYNFFSIECLPVNTTGFEELNSGGMRLTVFPNPARAEVTISCESQFSYSLFSTLGQVLRTGESGAGTVRVDIQTLAAGIYYVVAKAGNETVTRKLVVE
jgi:hypothetical protein